MVYGSDSRFLNLLCAIGGEEGEVFGAVGEALEEIHVFGLEFDTGIG